ncbi:MAG TPA: hypothetical protein VMT67_12490 [Terriglobales bacterium]|nr:hypothetical protein [Terriglobales bacterium]
MAEKLVRSKWFGVADFCIFAGLFVWLRWFSRLWQYRWTGLLFGFVYVLTSLWNPRKLMPWHDQIRRYWSPKVAWFAEIVAPLALGGIIMRHFFTGSAFFSFGPKAGSDDGFFGVVILASAVESA